MRIFIIILGSILVLSGILLLFDPEVLFEYIKANSENTSLYYGAILMRIIIGTVLIMASAKSLFPKTIKVIGYLILFVALGLIIMGHGQFQELIASVLEIFHSYGRIVAILIVAIGGLLIYAFTKRT